MQRTPCTIALLCKAPIPGFAKTLLIPHLGEMDAAHLQEELIMQAVVTALDAAVGPVELWCDPDESHPFFGKIMKKYPVRLTAQPPGDLSTRLHTCAAGSLIAADAVILMSVDCPIMPTYYLEEAAMALARGCDAIVGPSEDGGYVLLGLKRVNEELFDDIPWGTSLVLTETQARITQLGWRCHTLSTLWDVTTPTAYQRWRLITEAMPSRPDVQRL
ncbi:MAG TPA: TIGR04282 family arsenosugar biosynthesis glycosyltransferase [Gammaproteobacteria bacterium]|nr:TIGR04282 family arsenosugar biosynthesis glycosyltransferase [Gammaproteobacteria bacterium]